MLGYNIPLVNYMLALPIYWCTDVLQQSCSPEWKMEWREWKKVNILKSHGWILLHCVYNKTALVEIFYKICENHTNLLVWPRWKSIQVITESAQPLHCSSQLFPFHQRHPSYITSMEKFSLHHQEQFSSIEFIASPESSDVREWEKADWINVEAVLTLWHPDDLTKLVIVSSISGFHTFSMVKTSDDCL